MVIANRPSPASAARAAVSAAATVTRGIEHALLGGPAESGPKPDGRRARWEKHKQARRTELTDGTIAAIRELGADVGMDEIAGHIGISKTVLYRYFTDKNDLGVAVTFRFFETTLLPRLTDAISDEVDEYTLTRTVIEVYVNAVADEPALYRFAWSASPTSSVTSAESEKIVAQLLNATLVSRFDERSGDSSGAQVWSYMLVGAMQRAVDWWMVDRPIELPELIDYLVMMVWSSIVGVAASNGSRELFMAAPPAMPDPAPLPAPGAETDPDAGTATDSPA